MKGVKIKYTEQEKELIKELIINGKKMSDVIDEVLLISPSRTSDALFHIIRKIRNELKKENTIPSKSMYFYTDEQIEILINAINTGEPLLRIAKRFHKQFDRTEHNLYVKLQKLNGINKKQGFPKVKPNAIVLKKEKLNFIPEAVVQEPAEIGIEVPHGMTFEGKPKKIMLHSDHFRIYF